MKPAPTYIYTLSLHDALPIFNGEPYSVVGIMGANGPFDRMLVEAWLPLTFSPERMNRTLIGDYFVPVIACIGDRKSTRLNSSHRCISYAVFCLKKKITYSKQI